MSLKIPMRQLPTAATSSGEALTHFVDRMIVLAKRGDDLSRREAGRVGSG